MNNELSIDWTRINSDINGNPRQVCHYLEFKPFTPRIGSENERFTYEDALTIARTLGGRKFHNKQYGGGIVFSSYNYRDLEERIKILTGHAIKCHRQPTKGEINFGHGATHYRTFSRELLTRKDGSLKKWFKADDSLNYSIPQ